MIPVAGYTVSLYSIIMLSGYRSTTRYCMLYVQYEYATAFYRKQPAVLNYFYYGTTTQEFFYVCWSCSLVTLVSGCYCYYVWSHRHISNLLGPGRRPHGSTPPVCCHRLRHHPGVLMLSKVVVALSPVVRSSIAIAPIKACHLLEV